MDAAFIIFVVGLFLFSMLSGAGKNKTSSKAKRLTSAGEYDIPEALRAKWDAESQLRQSEMTPTQRGRANLSSKGQALSGRGAASGSRMALQRVSRSTQRQKQSRDAIDRNRDQRKEMARTGSGTPEDKNGNRRHDWGQRGNMGGGLIGPLLSSAIVAAALAALFTVA